MEADSTVIEESLLERQIEHETTSSKDTLEYSTTLAEKQRLQEERERLLGLSDTLEPVLRVCYQQLQILGKVQEGSRVVVTVKECVGRMDELEALLVDAKVHMYVQVPISQSQCITVCITGCITVCITGCITV
jgi:predicted KAP-like P-loop ATPase